MHANKSGATAKCLCEHQAVVALLWHTCKHDSSKRKKATKESSFRAMKRSYEDGAFPGSAEQGTPVGARHGFEFSMCVGRPPEAHG